MSMPFKRIFPPYQRGRMTLLMRCALTVLFLGWASAAVSAQNLIVFAAASLKDALDQTVQSFERDTGNKVTVSYAASSALAKQIDNGAPADLFISADTDWMDYLAKHKLINPASRINLLKNSLVLIAPAKSAIQIKIAPNFPLAEKLGSGRLAMANPEYVPAGKYGRAALQTLGVWASVKNRIAPAENVRAALVQVSRGEAPLGIVYQTDALADGNVRIVAEFPANTHPPIIYQAALTASSTHPEAANLLAFLGSAAGRVIFRKYGFQN
ncbi:MAG: molybdate ABC transporter substrate-binding protein [Burkholderiales bacterium]